jgi:UDP-GlcNAc:undecaprenyl-phosphate GlcNAc-1-phosphate transferase
LKMQFLGNERPLTWIMQFWPVLAVSALSAWAATALCRRIALCLGIVDRPDNLVKTHNEPVAYLGGIGILVGVLSGGLAGITCLAWAGIDSLALKWVLGILAGATVACVVGVIDDVYDLRPKYKFLGQVLAAFILVAVGIGPNLAKLVEPAGLSLPDSVEACLKGLITVIFVLGATNSLNLLDGLDGLCAGVTSIISLAMLLLAVHLATWGFSGSGDAVRIITALALTGGAMGFLPFNRHPARIFMGDAGSMLLGFLVAALMLLFAERFPRWCLASLMVFGLPILDTGVALVRRRLNHRPLFTSDRGHIYDQMIDRGMPLKKTVGICYALATMFALTGLVMSQIRTRHAVLVTVLVVLVSGAVVWKKGFLRMKGLRGAVQQGQSPNHGNSNAVCCSKALTG